MRSAGVSTSKAAIIAVVIIVIVAGGAYFALVPRGNQGGTTPTTSTSSSVSISSTGSTISASTFTPVQGNVSSVVSQVNLLIQAFNNQNVEAITSFYTDASVAVWSGQTQGLGGTYSGVGNIRILYSSSIGHASSIQVKPSHLKMVTESPTVVNDTINLFVSGTSQYLGHFNASVVASHEWVNNGGKWSVLKENWNYLTFAASNPSSGTVFPQWGLLLSGHSLDLASEHRFEWNVAPYMALALYVVIAAAVLLAVTRNRRRSAK